MPGTCTIACKLPHGLHMQLYNMRDRMVDGGKAIEKMAEPVGKRVTIRGVAHPLHLAPTVQIIGGYALTHDVDADFAAQWMKANADLPVVKNRLVFIQEKASSAASQAAEQASLRSGLEPIDPANMPREFRKVETAVTKEAA